MSKSQKLAEIDIFEVNAKMLNFGGGCAPLVYLEHSTVRDRTEIVEFTGLELEDEGWFPVNSPECQVNIGSIC